MVPNHRFIVEDVYDAGDYDLTTHAGQARYVDDAVAALHAHDQRWGHLKKFGNATNIHGHAEDAALYLSDTPGQSQAVDFISGAGGPNPQPGWGVDVPRYSRSDWYPPSEHPPLDEPEQPEPQPPHVCPPCPPVPTRTYPDEPTYWKAFQDRVRAAYVAVGRRFPDPNDPDAFRRFARCGFDLDWTDGMNAQQAAAKHIRELRQELGAPPE